MPAQRFIVEYDEDSDPSRNLTKYWPIIDEMGGVPLTLIEIWRRGTTIGQGYAELAKWMGARLAELYPTFVYVFIERKDEPPETIARKVEEIAGP